MNFDDIETQRFFLKVMKGELVADKYLNWFKDEEVKKYISFSRDDLCKADLELYVDEKLRSSHALMFGIFDKSDSTHIGNIKFEPILPKQSLAVLGVLIGDTNWRGKGVFGEIITTLEKELKTIGIRNIFLGVAKANRSALQAYQKFGFVIDSTNYLKLNLDKSYCLVKEI